MRRQLIKSTVVTTAGLAALALLTLRWTGLHWGATTGEVDETLPGDDVVPAAGFTATRAITIDAPPERVWPWIAQIGQGRGGFYSYDWLENLAGCRIHSADQIAPQWQHPEAGDTVRMHPKVALTVDAIDPGHSLVLRAPAGEASSAEFSWAFVVRPRPGRTTRLLVRERYGWSGRSSALLMEPLLAASSIMSRAMLRGIKERVERRAAA